MRPDIQELRNAALCHREDALYPGMTPPSRVLNAAGERAGQLAYPGGRDRDPAPAVPGYVVDFDSADNDPHATVEHVGKGRDAALVRYRQALETAGFVATIGPKRSWLKKPVVHVRMPSMVVTP